MTNKHPLNLKLAEISVELEDLGHSDLAKLLDTQPLRTGAGTRKLYIAAYTLNKEDVMGIKDPLDLTKPGGGFVKEISLPDRIRRRYWKHFPPDMLRDRRLRRPRRGKHMFGGIFIDRSEMHELYETARRNIRAVKEFVDTHGADVEPDPEWQRTLEKELNFEKWKSFLPKKELSSKEKRHKAIKKIQNDLLTFEEFFSELRIMWGKRGIASYLIYWS